MIITKRLKAKAIATWLGPTGDAARKALANVRERVTQTPRRLDFYYDLTDPWSYLTAQAVERLVDAYKVELAFHAITPPASDVDPAPTMRAKHAVRDAGMLADYYDVDFAGTKPADSGLVRDVGTALVRERAPRDQLRCALELGKAMWSVERKEVMRLLGVWGSESHIGVASVLNETYANLRKAGHYNGAMIAYKGEWYWGLDRLSFLEEALAADLGVPVVHVVSKREHPDALAMAKPDKPLVAEMWLSFRSPYSYIALEQIEAILAPYSIPLQLKYVPPMIARGLPVPSVKQMYIVRDAKRAADKLGIPFGEICDPKGKGIDNCLALAHYADSEGLLLPFMKSAMRGIWSEGKDMAEYLDLKLVVERAGLDWNVAKGSLDDRAGAKVAAANVEDMAVVNLWGVPSFRVGEFVAWGQDRLPMLAERLRRHALVQPAG